MKFGKKAFIISVISVILCLNLGFLSLAYFSYRHCVRSYQDAAKIRYENVAASFETTYDSVLDMSGGEGGARALMNSFVSRYLKDGVYLAFLENGEILSTSFDEGYELRSDNSVSTVKIGGVRYTVINSKVCDKYQMFFAVEARDIDREFNSLLITYSLSCAVICLLVTIILYYSMSRSSEVVECTLSSMEKIANGDMTQGESIGVSGDLAVVAGSFDRMCGAINKKADAVNQNADDKQLMVDMLANQLGAPLAQISREADEIIEKNAENEELVKTVRRIRKHAHRLQSTSEKLLDIATAREKALRVTDVDIPALLEDTAYSLSRYAKTMGISIETSLLPVKVKADEELLSLLFYNLAENAVKACHSGCTVMLSCEGKNVTVRDNGSGMSETQLELITKPFYKGENDRYSGHGSGLGLTLCKQIIDVHGADIKFESKPGYGTTVTVDFDPQN